MFGSGPSLANKQLPGLKQFSFFASFHAFLHQVNSKLLCDNTVIATVIQEKTAQVKTAADAISGAERVVTFSSGEISITTSCNSVLRGNRAQEKREEVKTWKRDMA